MTFELATLTAAAGLTLLLLFAQGTMVPVVQGLKWGLGPRDEQRPASVLQGRMKRIVANQLEAMTIFVPLVLISHLVGVTSPLTHLGATLFIAGRIAFAMVYALGVPVVRSLVWGLATTGLVLIGYELAKAAL